jgi:outer membrane receptor protein involved in Fe transport
VQDQGPWLHEITAEAGARYSRYSAAGGVWTYKAGAELAPTPDLRLRGSFNHAVRAPNVVDLFTPQTITAAGLQTDPCAGPDPLAANAFATPANCARTGVSASQYGHIADNPNGYNSLLGGNPLLTPEAADTFTIGAVVTPRAAPGFSLVADYYDVDIKNVLGVIGADLSIEQCLETGSPFFCRLIHRAAGTGSLWLGPQGYVIDITQNTASMRAKGVDIQADYRRSLPPIAGRDVGSVRLDLMGSYVLSRTVQTTPDAPAFDCAGLYGPTCGEPLPHWRHVLRIVWSTPWSADLDAAWRYVGPVDLDETTSNPVLTSPFDPVNARLGSQSVFDLALSLRIDRRLTLRLGADNVLDQDPPVFGFGGGFSNSNTFPGIYDTLGRYVFVGLTAQL